MSTKPLVNRHAPVTAPTPGSACTATYALFPNDHGPKRTRIVLFCPAGHELVDAPINGPRGKRLTAGDYSGESCVVCDWEPSIKVTLHIDNVYVEYGTVETTVETEVPAPPTDEDDRSEWEQDHIFPLTGAGLDGDAGYFVTVTQSSSPGRLPVGTKIEFC